MIETLQLNNLEKSFQEVMDNKVFHSASEAWVSNISKDYIRDVFIDWALDLADWKIFLTLTFRDGVYYDVCMNYWKNLVWVLNTDLVGKHYSQYVGHSYFSYLLGIEQQSRGDYHFHVLIDKPVNFRLVHDHWGFKCGFAKTELINEKTKAVQYITKYICKGGIVDPFINSLKWEPLLKPFWWRLDLIKDKEKNKEE